MGVAVDTTPEVIVLFGLLVGCIVRDAAAIASATLAILIVTEVHLLVSGSIEPRYILLSCVIVCVVDVWVECTIFIIVIPLLCSIYSLFELKLDRSWKAFTSFFHKPLTR